MFTGSAFKPALTVKSAKWQMQPTSYKVGISSSASALFMTLAVSDIKDTVLSKLSPFLVSDSFKAWNKLVAGPMFTTGMSKNLVHTSPICGSRSLTRMMQDLSLLSLDSSIIKENGPLDIDSITLCVKWGASAFFTMAVVLVREQENFFAIAESGKILLKSLVAWSLARKDMLCLTTNVAHLTSASIAWSLLWGRKREAIGVVDATAFDTPLCLLLLRWDLTSWRPPWVTPKLIAHRVHRAYKLPKARILTLLLHWTQEAHCTHHVIIYLPCICCIPCLLINQFHYLFYLYLWSSCLSPEIR